MGSIVLVSIPKRVSEALNPFTRLALVTGWAVSIPKRVSEALNPALKLRLLLVALVSIPKRVSEALNLDYFLAYETSAAFQSLKGFQRL